MMNEDDSGTFNKTIWDSPERDEEEIPTTNGTSADMNGDALQMKEIQSTSIEAHSVL